MAEYSRMAKGSFTAGAAYKYINLPFQPDMVHLLNYTNMAAGAAANKCTEAWWDNNLVVSGNNPTMVRGYTAGSVLADDVIASNGISAFDANLALQFGAQQQVVASTKATGNFEVTGHGYNTGDVVIFEGLYSTQYTAGMPQIDGMPFVVTKVDADNFTINWDVNQSAYTALAASPTGAYVKKVLYPFLYFPGVSFISAISTGATTTITTTAPHNLVVGQIIAFRIPDSFGTVELNALPNNSIPGSPVYYQVTSVSSSTQFVCNANSSSFTAYDSNIAVSDVSGLSFPQVAAIGDINTGGWPFYSGSNLYPSPQQGNTGTAGGGVDTINGPAIQGAFVNNTRQGFFIGAGAATNDSSLSIMTSSDVIVWYAYLHDIASP